jgi:chemotaxis protein methyltransferase CheR
MHISEQDHRSTAALVRQHFGIHLPASKRDMLAARLYRLVRETGCTSFSEFFRRHLSPPGPEMLSLLADHLSTNHTFFNREAEHFWVLRDRLLPELLQDLRLRGERDLRTWCAASSTGEEPATLAMVIQEALGPDAARWQAGLLATDLSSRALATARAGVYPTAAVRTLPAAYAERWFDHRPDGTSVLVPELRRQLTYRRFNLMNRRFPFRRPFHVIFCRNVMIYFEDDTKRALVRRLFDQTTPGGYLFIGHAESITGLDSPWQPVQPGLYRKDG